MTDTIPVYRPRPKDAAPATSARYVALRFPGPPDPRPWGIYDAVSGSFASGEAYTTEREAAFTAARMSAAYERAMAA